MVSGEGNQSKVQDIPAWEQELWSFVCRVNKGDKLPIYDDCETRKTGPFCLVDDAELFTRLRGGYSTNFADYQPLRYLEGCRLHLLAKKLAGKCLDKAGIDSPPVTEDIIPLIHTGHPIEVRTLPLKVSHGAVWHIGDEWIIHLNSNDTPSRRMMVLFHEYFHILASCHSMAFFSGRKPSKKCQVTETLADIFAAYILMPEEWFRQNCAKIGDLKQVAELCGVPETAAYIRCMVNGLVK